MSEVVNCLRYNQTYSDIADIIKQYFFTSTIYSISEDVGGKITYGETPTHLASQICKHLSKYNTVQNIGIIKYDESYENLARNTQYYLEKAGVPVQTFSPSIYPIWWDTVITIYNRYEDSSTQYVTWKKHIIPNCFVKLVTTQISGGQIIYNSSNAIIRIPQNNIFKDYADWVMIPNVDMGKYFTIRPNDIIIIGAVDDTIEEYTAGKRSSDLTDKYNRLNKCIIVQNWQNNTGRGRVCPHYFVSGG